ncbi:MAG: Hpt domain-containing protein [Caulobacterales bacterium]|jgi:HPt (histidine-containing phosphotransfer) domain-containing protein
MSRPRIEPASHKLRQKIGGSARTLIGPQAYADAEAALQAVADQVRPLLLAQINQLEELSRQRPFNAPSALYAYAHSIRGLAGTCGMPFVGQAAGALCRLLVGVDDGAQIDANLVTSIAVTVIHAVKAKATDHELLEELIATCFEAVDKVRPQTA